MFSNYLKVAFRHFWKNRRYSMINMVGLALSLTCFIMVVLYVQNEKSYDQWNPLANRVFQVNFQYKASDLTARMALKAGGQNGQQADVNTTTPTGLGPLLQDNIPEVAAYNRISMAEWEERLFTLPDQKKVYVPNVVGVDSTFFSIFAYPFRYGQPDHALDRPDAIVLFPETAQKLFGAANPLGQTLQLDNGQTYTVTGVVDKTSTPSALDFGAVLRSRHTDMPWGYKWFFTYVLLRPGADPHTVATKMDQVLYRTPAAESDFGDSTTKILLTPFSQLYLHPATANQPGKKGNPLTLSILMAMGLLIVVVSCINFTNLSMTQAAGRAKEVGIRKVMGTSRRSLSLLFLGETFIQCGLSIVLALAATRLLLPFINQMLQVQLSLLHHPYNSMLFLYLLGIWMGTTLLSGLYPALFLSGYQPAKVLKGNFLQGHTGNGLRKGLIVLQFMITTGFIISILIINRQFQFLKNRDIGFQPEQIVDVRIHDPHTAQAFSTLQQRLLQIPGIQTVSRVDNPPASSSMTHSAYINEDNKLEFDEMHIDYAYFQTLGLQPLSGRLFDKTRTADSLGVLLNETAARKYHLMDSVGRPLKALSNIGAFTLLGIVPDYNQRGIDAKVAPTAFFLSDPERHAKPDNRDDRRHVLIRLEARQATAALSGIKTLWQQVEPDYPIQYDFLDRQFARYLNRTIRLGKLVSLFTLCALIISLFGLLSLAALMAEQRTRELAIRKVLGAGTRHLLWLLNKQFFTLIVLANVLAWPLCYLLIHRWLNNYNHRIGIPLMPFILAALITIGLTLLTVSWQTRESLRSPATQSLKYE